MVFFISIIHSYMHIFYGYLVSNDSYANPEKKEEISILKGPLAPINLFTVYLISIL